MAGAASERVATKVMVDFADGTHSCWANIEGFVSTGSTTFQLILSNAVIFIPWQNILAVRVSYEGKENE